MAIHISHATRDANIAPQKSSKRINLSESIIGGIVAIIDAGITLTSGLVILLLYLDTSEVNLSVYATALVLTTYVVLHAFHIAGLYKFRRIVKPAAQFVRIAAACTLVFLVLVATAYVFKASDSFSRVWALSWLAATTALVPAGRFLIAWTISIAARKGLLTRRIVVYGTNEVARDFVKNLGKAAQPWNEVIGVFDDRKERKGPATELLPVSGDLEALVTSARRQRVDEVLVSLPWTGANDRIDYILKKLSVLPTRVNLAIGPSLAKYLRSGIFVEFGIPATSIYERPITGWQAFIKRGFDLFTACFIMCLLWPLFVLIAIAIKLDSRGPIFFRQDRFGFNDELIPIWKFRTMYQDQADKNAERLATIDDPRITRVGAFLRRTSLDELPQLFNIIIGNMSLVGPRPHATRAKAGGRLYQEVIECYGSRHRVKPGLTGWAQVNGWRGETDTDEKIVNRVEHDLYYISHWSLWLDIKILFRTVRVVLKGENAY